MTAGTHTAPVRAELVVRFCEQVRSAAGPKVLVEEGWPGDNLGLEHVWVEDVDGKNVWELMMAGRHTRDDQFSVDLRVRVNKPTRSAALLRCDELVGVIGDVVADSVFLNGEVDPSLVVTISDVKGPISVPELEGNGFDALAGVTLECENRIY